MKFEIKISALKSLKLDNLAYNRHKSKKVWTKEEITKIGEKISEIMKILTYENLGNILPTKGWSIFSV